MDLTPRLCHLLLGKILELCLERNWKTSSPCLYTREDRWCGDWTLGIDACSFDTPVSWGDIFIRGIPATTSCPYFFYSPLHDTWMRASHTCGGASGHAQTPSCTWGTSSVHGLWASLAYLLDSIFNTVNRLTLFIRLKLNWFVNFLRISRHF